MTSISCLQIAKTKWHERGESQVSAVSALKNDVAACKIALCCELEWVCFWRLQSERTSFKFGFRVASPESDRGEKVCLEL